MKLHQGISYRVFKRYVSEKGISLSESQMSIAAHILDLNLNTPDSIDDTLINSVREFIVDKHEHLDILMGYSKKLHEMSKRRSSMMLAIRDPEKFEAWLIEMGYYSSETEEMIRLINEE